MSCCRSAHPAWVHDISPHSRPARHASYPPLAPREVAYLPVWSLEGGSLKRREGVVLQDDAGNEATTTATAWTTATTTAAAAAWTTTSHYDDGHEATTTATATTGHPCTQPSLDVESRAMGVIRNLPSRCRDVDVLDAISRLGFGSDVTAFNMPTRVQAGSRILNRGFAFVYFSDEGVCRRFVQVAAGYCGFGKHLSSKAISVEFSVIFAPHVDESPPKTKKNNKKKPSAGASQ